MKSNAIFVIEPDVDHRSRLVATLRSAGHEVGEASNAARAIAELRENVADLALIEWDLPDLPGIEVLQVLRSDPRFVRTRVLMTSARNDHAVAAFDAGADDFIGKPYQIAELMARATNCLQKPAASQAQHGVLDAGPIVMDEASHRVSINNHLLDLAPREYCLLQFFMSNPDRLYSRKQLITYVWDQNGAPGERTVDVHVRRLRSRLTKFNCENFIQTIRGRGYRFSVLGSTTQGACNGLAS